MCQQYIIHQEDNGGESGFTCRPSSDNQRRAAAVLVEALHHTDVATVTTTLETDVPTSTTHIHTIIRRIMLRLKDQKHF